MVRYLGVFLLLLNIGITGKWALADSESYRELSRLERIYESVMKPIYWARGQASNLHGALSVLDLMYLEPIQPGLLTDDHPWVTGLNPVTGETIWKDNVVFSTIPIEEAQEVASKIGAYLARMVEKPASSLEAPFGVTNRMPIAVNYLHGTVHYNSGFIVFKDFSEGVHYFSDPAFNKEIRRFSKKTKRELVVVFQEQRFDPDDYAHLIGVVRTHLPWFANPNGLVRGKVDPDHPYVFDRKVLWGAPAPYPSINLISGNWIYALRLLREAEAHPENLKDIVFPSIEKGVYFQGSYGTPRTEASSLEKWVADFQSKQLHARKPGKGNIAFTDQRELTRESELKNHRSEYSVVLPDALRVSVVILGSGPTGVALAKKLKDRGISVWVVEERQKLGSATLFWPQHFRTSMAFKKIALPDTPKDVFPMEKYPTTERIQQYLVDYAQHFSLPVTVGDPVASIQVDSDRGGATRVLLHSGKKIWTEAVIDTTEPSRSSTLPQIKGLGVMSRWISVENYQNPEQLFRDYGNGIHQVLVVGATRQAGLVANELDRVGIEVTVALQKEVTSKAISDLDPPLNPGRTARRVQSGALKVVNNAVTQENDFQLFDLVIDARALPDRIEFSQVGGTHRVYFKEFLNINKNLDHVIDEVRVTLSKHIIPWFGGTEPLIPQDVTDLMTPNKKRVQLLPPVFDESTDVLLAFAPKCGHVSLFAGGYEYHGRLWYNSVKVFEESHSAMGGILLRFSSLTPDQLQTIKQSLLSVKGSHSLHCLEGALGILAQAGIKMRAPSSPDYTSIDEFSQILREGFVDERGESVPVELFQADTGGPDEMQRYLEKAYRTYGPVVSVLRRVRSGLGFDDDADDHM